jgi:hypothetical protein
VSFCLQESDPSVLKVQLPCGQKQQARLSFLTPTFSPNNSTSNNSSNSKGSKSKSQHHQNGMTIVTGEGHTDLNPEETHHITIMDHQTFQQLTQVSIMPGGSYPLLVPGALPGQIAATVTVGTPIIGSSASGSGSSNGSESSSSGSGAGSKKQHQSNNSSSSLQNGLIGLTNLSLSLGGQIREAPFANCDANGLNKKTIVQLLGCSECPSTFTSEKDLTAHMKTHKPQNYRCSECPRAYTRREKLTEHIRCFHQGQKFKCEYCGKELSRKDHVLRHVRSIHPEVLASRFTAVSFSCNE